MIKNKIKVLKSGFTLAEVLIVISIIGIVAALTIPTMVANVQKQILANELKNGYAILQAGFRKAMADNATDNFEDTDLFEHCNAANPSFSYGTNAMRDSCAPYMSKYFKNLRALSVPDMMDQGDNTNIITDTETCNKLVGKTNKWWYLNDQTKCRGWKNVAFTFNNGMRADIGIQDSTCYSLTKPCESGFITLDVNGEKGPNTWGRDAFYFIILPDGRVVGYGSHELSLWLGYYYYGTMSGHYVKSAYWATNGGCTDTTAEEGVSCAGRLIDNDFVFDY